MRREALLELLRQLEANKIAPEEAADRLASLPFEDLGFAKVDHHRSLRSGMPEVILASGKTPEQVAIIFAELAASGVNVLATRASQEHFDAVREAVPAAEHHQLARCITLLQSKPDTFAGHVAVVCAGTSDLPVAEEAAITAELFGARVTRLTDVGVAGMHRLLSHLEALRAADVIVVCAGMEGALPSVVGGLVAVPVIAVPTSVGYGAAFEGVTALLSMLNSCSPNITVVNIDNGFGAGYIATLIARGPKR
jgi:pyridinium-3,5-biscarboxylic acid mononucleotide synthase